MYLHRTPFWLKLLYPSLTWNKSRKEKTLYLTFDDGPIPEITDFVLEELDKFNAKATFFCVGENIQNHPEVFRRILYNGHSVGNHTFNHLNGWKVEDGDYFENVRLCHQVIQKTAAEQTRPLLRPPYGKIKRRQAKILQDDYEIVMWDVLAGDFDKNLLPEKCLFNTIRATRNGSIIIFHDSLKAAKTLKFALPRYLKHFSDQGYQFRQL